MSDWVIYGGGGHSRVIANAIASAGNRVIGYFDDNTNLFHIGNIPVQSYHEFQFSHAKLIIGIGNNAIRKKIASQISHRFGTIIHPQAIVADDAIIGEGTVILAGAVIQSGAVIGEHVVVNANVTVDHDARIGDFCSIYPGAYIGGGVKIGSGVTIEACTAIKSMSIVPGVFEDCNVIESSTY